MAEQTGSAQIVVHGKLKEQAAQKEKEWRELQELQIQTLEAALKDCRKELTDEKAKMGELKEHFKYNLRLIGDRDSELQRYDAVFAELKSVVLKKEQDISDLKVKIDELKITAGRESKAREEMQLHYQQRIREKQAEVEQSRSVKDAEINAERESLEVHKKILDRRIIELEQELDKQQRETALGFEEAMRKREHEYRVEMDKMNCTVLAHELKVKMLVKEIEMMKAAHESDVREFAQSDTAQRELEKQLRQKEWEFEDLKAMSNAKIAELEGKLQQNELVSKRHQNDFERRFAEADRLVKEKDAALLKFRESANEREHHLQSEIQSMAAKLEDSSVRLRQLEWNVQDLEKEKSNAVERLEEELSEIKLQWESNVAEMSRSHVARDLELNALRDNQSKIKVELEQRKHDNERYKKDLASAVERQAILEQSRAQLELDWQRRYEDLERLQYSHSEDLVRTLTKARDEALAEVRVKDNEIQEKDDLIHLLSSERDQALATLNKHGLMADRNVQVTPVDQSDSVISLQKQNEELRQVIKQMRFEMESLGERLPSADVQTDHDDTFSREGVTDVKQTEDKGQNSRSRVAANSSFIGRALSDNDRDFAKDSVLISSHVQQLNNTIGAMRSERTEIMAQLRKQQLRIVHLENMNDQLSKQPREKQVEIDQLQYELNASKRRMDAEISSLRQRTADLELQVTEARKEADEYYRASIERNTEATALANQLSQMKLELAKSNPTINFGAQELMIQQLQDELTRVRRYHANSHQANSINSVQSDISDGALMSNDVDQLRAQLQKSVRRIAQLSKDKEVLIELGNRLRAQLMHHGVKLPSPPSGRRRIIEPPAHTDLSIEPAARERPVSHQRTMIQQNYQNKLKELEQLQYDLTKQELAQQRRVAQRRSSVGSTDESRLPRSSDSEADQPRSILKSKASSARRDSGANDRLAARAQSNKTSARRVVANDDVAPVRLQSSVSSTGGGADSLQDIWAMMDADGGPSPQLTSRTPRYTAANSLPPTTQANALPSPRPQSTDTDSWTVHGSRPNIQSKITHKKNVSPKTGGKIPTAIVNKSKVRNYNMKDDLPSAR